MYHNGQGAHTTTGNEHIQQRFTGTYQNAQRAPLKTTNGTNDNGQRAPTTTANGYVPQRARNGQLPKCTTGIYPKRNR